MALAARAPADANKAEPAVIAANAMRIFGSPMRQG
jgi:hypothetical protein